MYNSRKLGGRENRLKNKEHRKRHTIQIQYDKTPQKLWHSEFDRPFPPLPCTRMSVCVTIEHMQSEYLHSVFFSLFIGIEPLWSI